MLSYAVVGSGAIGAFYGGKLAYAGCHVDFLFHSDFDHVRTNGLIVNSCNGNFSLSPDLIGVYDDVWRMPKADVVIVGLKTVREELVGQLVAPLLKDDSVVLLIQNGIGVEDDVQRMLPGTQLVAGLAFICSSKTQPGVVDHHFFGSLNLGPFSLRNRDFFSQVISDFSRAGVDVHEVEYAQARWMKAVWNVPFNGLSVVLDCQTDTLVASQPALELVRGIMDEVVGAARALGVSGVDDAHADKMVMMTKEMVPYSPSMRLDRIYGRPLEIQYIYNKTIQAAAAAGFSMPRTEMLMRQLMVISR